MNIWIILLSYAYHNSNELHRKFRKLVWSICLACWIFIALVGCATPESKPVDPSILPYPNPFTIEGPKEKVDYTFLNQSLDRHLEN
jgi:hypothetical protein